MEYRKPLDKAQLGHALKRLRNFKAYLRSLEVSFAPRDAEERRLLRRARRCAQKFAASIRAGEVDEMNRWSHRADAEFWAYWMRRRTE